MNKVKAKKHLGQHFLHDQEVCIKISDYIKKSFREEILLEVGPGTGAISKYLLPFFGSKMEVCEIDHESIQYLTKNYPELEHRIINKDFLQIDFKELYPNKSIMVVGNFPYYISSQILFHCLAFKNQIPQVIGMFQKELAERICEKAGKKSYGIISVLLQCYYNIDYCFTVNEQSFSPPPKVKSAIIHLKRNDRKELPCDEKFFIQIVKTSFNQRRKMLRNSLKSILKEGFQHPFLNQRPEQLSVEDFIAFCLVIEEFDKNK